METKTTKRQVENARRDYPGAAVNAADDNHVSPEMVKNRNYVQNDNPRSDDGPRPLK